jgi:hypothetical protein
VSINSARNFDPTRPELIEKMTSRSSKRELTLLAFPMVPAWARPRGAATEFEQACLLSALPTNYGNSPGSSE